MKVICSWCKKLLGEKEPFEDKSVSHAKCAECLERQGRRSRGSRKRSGDSTEETPAEMASRLDQVTSILAEGFLKLIEERQNTQALPASANTAKKVR